MLKFLSIILPAVLALAGLSTSATAFELHRSSPEACLARYGSAVLSTEMHSVSESCRKHLFPPAPKAAPLAHYTFGGDLIRQVAQDCAERFGEQARMADIVGPCRVFYYPTMTNPLVSTIKLPPQEAGGLY